MKWLHTGPKIKGNRLFDDHCVFGNNMELTKYQVGYLEDIVGDCAGEPIKLYIYRMSKSSVIRNKAKMVTLFDQENSYCIVFALLRLAF